MRITYKGDYALKAILDLALYYEKGVVTINEISKRADIPLKFLEQVLLDLKRGGFVVSKRGKEGGYSLAKDPSKVTVGDVVRFIDGPVEPIACIGKKYVGCNDVYKCVFRKIWQEVAQSTSLIVDNVTFADLIKEVNINKTGFVYSI